MATSPVIPTPRLRLEPFAQRHLTARYVAWLNHPETTRFSEQRHRTHTLESCRAYWQSFENSPHYFWALVAMDDAFGHIGNMNAYLDPANGVADIGILVGEASARGHGLATEAWLGVCDWLLRGAGVRKVTAGTLVTNAPMLAIMRRAGMAEDGVRRRQYVYSGEEVDMEHGALFREEWLKRFPAGPFSQAERA